MLRLKEHAMNDYAERIRRAIDWMEGHLKEKTDLEAVAGVACLSPFHFSRVFCAMTGETVMSYLRKRRLSAAFDELLSSDKSIIDIALEYRYESVAAFTRAFASQFRIAPSRLRAKRKRIMYGYYPAMDGERLARRMSGGVSLEARIVDRGPIMLAGLSCENSASKNGIPMLWGKFIRAARKIPGAFDGGTYGAYIYDFGRPKGDIAEDMPFTYLAAIDASACPSLPGDFSRRALPAGKWAVFTHRGYLRDIPKSYEFIFGAWFTKSDWQSAPAEHFEYRGPGYKGDFPDSVTEIWIPLLEGAAKP